MSKESAYNAGDMQVWSLGQVRKIPLGRNPAGYSPKGPKESDTTEWLSTQHFIIEEANVLGNVGVQYPYAVSE